MLRSKSGFSIPHRITNKNKVTLEAETLFENAPQTLERDEAKNEQDELRLSITVSERRQIIKLKGRTRAGACGHG